MDYPDELPCAGWLTSMAIPFQTTGSARQLLRNLQLDTYGDAILSL